MLSGLDGRRSICLVPVAAAVLRLASLSWPLPILSAVCTRLVVWLLGMLMLNLDHVLSSLPCVWLVERAFARVGCRHDLYVYLLNSKVLVNIEVPDAVVLIEMLASDF